MRCGRSVAQTPAAWAHARFGLTASQCALSSLWAKLSPNLSPLTVRSTSGVTSPWQASMSSGQVWTYLEVHQTQMDKPSERDVRRIGLRRESLLRV